MSDDLCRFAIAAFIMSISSCAIAEGTNKLEFKIDQVLVRLEEHSGLCFAIAPTLKNKTQAYDLGIPWPCDFHRNMEGSVRIIQGQGYSYLLVESSKHQPDAPRDCETHLRAIRATNSKLEVSQHKDVVTSCPPFQWDTIMFTELFD